MSTLAPSAGMMSGTRGAVAMNRSISDCCAAVIGSAAGGGGGPSRGKKATADAAAPRNTMVTAMASGLPLQRRTSWAARRGSVVMGKVVAAPEIRNSAITAAYVVRHRIQTVFSTTNDA